MKQWKVTQYADHDDPRSEVIEEVSVEEYCNFECPRCNANVFHVFIDMGSFICVQCLQCSRIFHFKHTD